MKFSDHLMSPVTILRKFDCAWLNISFLWETKVGRNQKTGPFPGQNCDFDKKIFKFKLCFIFRVILFLTEIKQKSRSGKLIFLWQISMSVFCSKSHFFL